MSEADIEYRDHFIDAQGFEAEAKRWLPKAVVRIYQNGTLHRENLSAPVGVLFDSEVAADTYSLAMAKKWIDEKLAVKATTQRDALGREQLKRERDRPAP
jgi:hypothetical protein